MVRKGWSVLCAEKDYWEGALMVNDMLLTFTSMVRDGKPTTEGYIIVTRKSRNRTSRSEIFLIHMCLIVIGILIRITYSMALYLLTILWAQLHTDGAIKKLAGVVIRKLKG